MDAIPDMTRLALRWVDVFATGPLTGNPLVVVLCDAHPSVPTMQALATELGVSETVFAAPGSPPTLRIFTPRTELPMAGHPLVGTAWVLRDEGWIGDEGTLRAPGGDVAVTADAHGAFMRPPAPRGMGDVDAHELAAALGCPPSGRPRASIWNAGLSQVMLPVPDPAALAPDHRRLAALGARDGWDGISAYRITASAAGSVRAEVRHFAAPIGIDEDPVTGSAAGALAAALAEGGHGSDGMLHLTVLQGHAMGRAGEVRVDAVMGADGPGIRRVGGRVLPVLAGVIG